MRDQPSSNDTHRDEPPHRPGRLEPLPLRVLAILALVGVVTGWLLRVWTDRLRGPTPTGGWLPAFAFAFVAGFLFFLARATRRALGGQQQRPSAHEMVNRFVAGRASALVGALFAGGYAGYALSWLGSESEMAGQRAIRAGVAAVSALAMTVAAVLLERACRTGSDTRDP